jgi:rubrerythrin
MKEGKNKKILERIAAEEKEHYEIWKGYTGRSLKPEALKVWWRKLMAMAFWFTFTNKAYGK